MPVSASSPEGRSRAKTGLPAALMASITVRSRPSTGAINLYPGGRRRSSRRQRGFQRASRLVVDHRATRTGRLRISEGSPSAWRGLRKGVCSGQTTRRGRRIASRRDDVRARRRRRRCYRARRAPALWVDVQDRGPRRAQCLAGSGERGRPPAVGGIAPHSSASQAAAPRPAFSIRSVVGKPRVSAAWTSRWRSSWRDKGRIRGVIGLSFLNDHAV